MRESSLQSSTAPLWTTLRDHLDGVESEIILSGQSGSEVLRLKPKGSSTRRFLKIGRGTARDELVAEMTRLAWVSGHCMVPETVCFALDRDVAWLLTTAMDGEGADAALSREASSAGLIVDGIAAYLRDLHALPISSCPYAAMLEGRMAEAKARVSAGLVDSSDFDECRRGWTAEDVWNALEASKPAASSLVVTHGDFSLSNILVHNRRVSGVVDWGKLGVADRHQDLALLWRDLSSFGSALQERFLRSYGLATLDRRSLEFYALLDECF